MIIINYIPWLIWWLLFLSRIICWNSEFVAHNITPAVNWTPEQRTQLLRLYNHPWIIMKWGHITSGNWPTIKKKSYLPPKAPLHSVQISWEQRGWSCMCRWWWSGRNRGGLGGGEELSLFSSNNKHNSWGPYCVPGPIAHRMFFSVA